MRHASLSIAAILMVAAAAFTSCSKDDGTDMAAAPVKILRSGTPDTSSFEVSFVPSANAVRFEYLLGTPEMEKSFMDGSADGIASHEGNDSIGVRFDNLEAGKKYSVFARAYGKTGTPGGLARCDISTMSNAYDVQTQFITSNSASFRIEFTSDYINFRYLLGKESEKEAFLSGELQDGSLQNIIEYYCASYFDLEAGDYVFYAQGEDISGAKTRLFEIPFSTADGNSMPSGEFGIISQDAYMGKYSITPNDNCGKITCYISTAGQYDNLALDPTSWRGDYVAMLQSWEQIPGEMPSHTATAGTLEFSYTDPSLALGQPMEIYALFFDKGLNPAGVQHFKFSKPEFDENAPQAHVDVKVDNISYAGAVYTFTPDENTLAFMYETVDAAWYDDIVENSSDYHEFYLHEYLFEQGFYFAYANDLKDGTLNFAETSGSPSTRYYAAACPMNANATQGWCEATLVQYTTTEKTN